MKRWLAILIPAAILAGLIGWRLEQKAADTAKQAQARELRKSAPVPVTVAAAKRRNLVATFESIGNVEAPFNVKMAPKATGRIDYLEVREGDPVRQGQVLVRIDPSEAEAQVRQQQAQVAQARYRLAQAQLGAGATNVGVSSQVRQQEAALASATAVLNQARSNDAAQVAAADAYVSDAQGKVNAAAAAIANAEAALRSARANLENARSRYNRVHDLYSQGFIAAQDVDDARTAVSVQNGAVDVALGQLDSAKAAHDSAVAQRTSAQQQARIVRTKGKTDIAAAQAQVKQARASLATARANTSQAPAYSENIAALRAVVDAAVAQLHTAQAQLSDTVLRSPITGFVTARYADPGAVASPSQPVLAVQAMRQVYVTVPAPEDVSRQITPGQTATVRFDAWPGRTFTARVGQVNPAADPTSRQFTVRLVLDNPKGILRPGMFARVSIVTQRIHGALVVPREAVHKSPDGATVTVVGEDSTAQTRTVETGASDTDGIAITSGLQPGDKVVTMSVSALKDGQKVRASAGRGRNRAGATGRRG